MMSNYLTAAVLTARMTASRINSLCNVTGNAQTSLINDVIDRAEAVINGYAAKRYQIPMTASDLLEEWTLCIAEYELYKRGPGSNVPDKIKESYKNTIAQLTDLSEGRLDLQGNTLADSASSISVHSQPAYFDADSMGGY